jgi:hypothetical protein
MLGCRRQNEGNIAEKFPVPISHGDRVFGIFPIQGQCLQRFGTGTDNEPLALEPERNEALRRVQGRRRLRPENCEFLECRRWAVMPKSCTNRVESARATQFAEDQGNARDFGWEQATQFCGFL